ncbi:MAG: citryl-CoA lyase [Gammaproteobacteria bacterium]
MKGPDLLAAHHGRIRTAMGACYPGSHAVFRGHDLHGELADLDWVELFVFGITGRRLTPAQKRMVGALWVHTSYPDARLWNNRVAALAASNRSTPNLGLVAALAVSEATVYGGQAGLASLGFLQRAAREVADGAQLETLVLAEAGQRRVYGYGRPINSLDERIPGIMALARELGLAEGVHLKLAFDIEAILVARWPQLRMNYAALHAAIISDMGMNAREYQMLRLPTFLAGMPPGIVDAADKPAGAFLPIRCDDIDYTGVAKREWP